ncbi:MAG: MarR family transcriptional regulator [Muribaculaceae bacterium]
MDKQTILKEPLGFYLDRAFNSLVARLNVALDALGAGINHSQFIIVRTLDAHDGLSQNDIARKLHRDPAAVSRSVKVLIDKGIIERTVLNGCKYGLSLTDKGSSIIPMMSEAIISVTEEALKGIGDSEYDNGIRFLTSIYNNTERE